MLPREGDADGPDEEKRRENLFQAVRSLSAAATKLDVVNG